MDKSVQDPQGQTTTNHRQTDDVSTTTHATRYLILGIIIAIFNYALFMIFSNIIIKNTNLLWLSTLICTTITTFLAYGLHSRITWKERPITSTAKYKFLIWNLLGAFIINPILTQFFALFTPLYDSIFGIVQHLNIPFSYNFVLTTTIFVLTAIITTILNFLFYDKFVFHKTKK